MGKVVDLKIIGIVVIALLICNVCSADDPILRKIEAVQTNSPPKIDGKLDDSCWQKAAQTGEFIQFQPLSGEPASQQTKVYLLYDENRLYIGFECFKDDMNNLAANSTQRDSFFFSDDHVEVLVDTYLDGRNCYAFALNPLGTQTDRRITNEGANVRRGGSNPGSAISWDCDWDGRAAKYEDRWTAEFSIPFAELRFPKKNNPHVAWGINFWRNDESREEEQSWVDLADRQYAVSRFGHLTELPLEGLVTKRPLELKPYAAIKPEKISGQETDLNADTGVDLRYPLSSLTVDFTLNPDFAQIEADPDVVNLSDIPLRFPEKRPFFLEGNELFQTPIELFYSRRVEDLMRGGKVVGKIGNYNLAAMSAQARPENDSALFHVDSKFQSDLNANKIPVALQRQFKNNGILLSENAMVSTQKKNTSWLINDEEESGLHTVSKVGNKLNIYDDDVGEKILEEDILPPDEYNYSVFRVQREFGRTSSIGLLGVSKQRGSLYDRASGVDARLTLPENVNLSLNYAKEWKSGFESDDMTLIELSRSTNTFSFRALYADIGEHFNVETGFVPRIDRRGVVLSTRYNKQYKGLVQRLRGEVQYERLENHAGQRMNERRGMSGLLGIKDFFFLLGPEWYYHVNDDDVAYTDKTVRFFAGWFPPKWVTIRNIGTVGIRDDKDTYFIRPEITFRPTSKLNFEVTLQRLIEDGELEQWTRRLTINYQFAQRMFARSSAEFTLSKERRIFGLFAYEYRPESTFFIVYNDNRDEEGETERILFVKIAHLLKVGLF
ncbi:carbohydrate binding family 9 domain-containing protein [Candidatus Poribacteria bacterium]|nr:carbohydrate binding family 9 domain-containing protein [Candidatus Poribacteria bacterium]